MSKLFKYFAGRYVNVIMKNIKGSQQLPDGSTVRGNVVIEGFLLDEDEKFYFLGTTDAEVDDSLHKNDVIRISLEKESFNEQTIEMDDDAEVH